MSTESIVHLLPTVNACLNLLATILLTAGFIAIRKDREANQRLHRGLMLAAFGVSCLFLALYLTHKGLKANLGDEINTTFTGEGIWRMVYYPMLLTHVLLAMVIVPLILITFTFALKGKFSKHQAWAKWTFPLWYYVSVTGVLVYLFLYQWFPS